MPFTGEVLGYLPNVDEQDVELAVAGARTAQARWCQVPFQQRAPIFLRFHDLLFEPQNEALDLIQLESGKRPAPRV
jgi:acyl-CoA reductase-like NAD-dependent aldehyde dehydrogenase